MTSLIESLTKIKQAPIAKEAFDFVKGLNCLPDEDQLINLITSINSANDLGHKLNFMFVDLIKSALARSVILKHKRRIKQLIDAHYEKDELNSSLDKFTIRFLDHEIKYPCADKPLHESLDELYYIVKDYANKVLGAGIEKEISYSVFVPQWFIEKLFAIDGLKGLLYHAELKESANNQLYDTYILNISELRSLAEIQNIYLTVSTDLVLLFMRCINTEELVNYYQYNPSYFIFKVKHQG